MNQYKDITTKELDTAACKIAREIDALRCSTTNRDGHEIWTKRAKQAREKISNLSRTLAAMDQELDRRHA